jgi:hypothetical protein
MRFFTLKYLVDYLKASFTRDDIFLKSEDYKHFFV